MAEPYQPFHSPAVRGGQTVSKTVASEANEVGSIPTGAASSFSLAGRDKREKACK